MAKHIYRGNPGYEFLLPGRVITPAPGDEVELTREEAGTLGGDFEPVNRPAPAAFDPGKAKKAELLDVIEAQGLDVDTTGSLGDIRSAVADALSSAPAESTNGQEG